jgi:cytochrome c-type biogenesis protein CcmI
MSLVLGAALFATAVILFILQPLLTGRWAPMERDDDEMTDAEARRRVTLLALRDVEYDRVTGKLDDKDYQELRRELSAEALAALAAEREERSADAIPSGVEGDLETQIQRVRAGLKQGTTCRVCGHVNPARSRFCSSCGTALTADGPGEGTGG